MNIAHIEEHSFIYGPNCRFVIWVQGCSIHCKGCWNKEMWAFEDKTNLSVQALLHKIGNEKDDIDGITLLGGEPLEQFKEVAELLIECRKLGLSTMLFTGYEMKEIEEKQMASILDNLDILITGRYDKTKRTMNHQWIGSTNQEIHFLTDRYKNFEIVNSNYVEISIDDFGSNTILGFPDKNLLETFHFDNKS
jgi:anaerobic ribonucleoside-triphosphate reductase activating protein